MRLPAKKPVLQCLAVVSLLPTGASAYNTMSYDARWEANRVYYVNPQNGDVSPSAVIAAVRSSADAWGSQSRASFAFVYGGTTAAANASMEGTSVVIFRDESGGGTLAITYRWASNGHLVDADIIFYDGSVKFFTGSSGCSGGYYVEDIGAHEFGHALGLDHSSVSGATMVLGVGWCSTSPRSLAADDIAGVEYLYPPTLTTTVPPRAPTGVRVFSRLLGDLASDPTDTLVWGRGRVSQAGDAQPADGPPSPPGAAAAGLAAS